MDWVLCIMGICAGNTLWFLGMVVCGAGIWGIATDKEAVLRMTGMMGLMTGGPPPQLAVMLNRLVEPSDRTTLFGLLMLVVGLAMLGGSGALILHCAAGSSG